MNKKNKPKLIRREKGAKNKLIIKEGATVCNDVQIDMSGEVVIEEYAAVYHGVKITTHKHHWPTRALRKDNQTIEKINLIIGRDAFIGQNAYILAIESIGEGAVIGARSVVTKNVPPFEVWAGNPARKIGERKEEEE